MAVKTALRRLELINSVCVLLKSIYTLLLDLNAFY